MRAKKSKNPKKLWGWWLLLIGSFLAIGLLVGIFQMLSGSLWDGQGRINFVLGSERVILASFDPQEEELVLLTIPPGTLLEVTHGYGKYRAEAVGKLEELEKRQGLLAESLQENLGIPVEGMVNSPPAGLSADKAGEAGKLKIVNSRDELLGVLGDQILGRGETNLTKWDLGRFWWQIRGARLDKTRVLDLAKINVLIPQTLPDQTKVWEIDSARLDSYLAKFFLDSKMREENLEIEILNGTSHFGLAERGARMITNMGGMVVRVGNFELQIANCKLQIAKNKKNLYTARKIGKIFNCEWEEKKEEGTAEITLILGEDYWQKLNQK